MIVKINDIQNITTVILENVNSVSLNSRVLLLFILVF